LRAAKEADKERRRLEKLQAKEPKAPKVKKPPQKKEAKEPQDPNLVEMKKWENALRKPAKVCKFIIRI
jgi:hypothetical protein